MKEHAAVAKKRVISKTNFDKIKKEKKIPGLEFCKQALSGDITDLDKTPPDPTRGIIVCVKVHEAREMEPVFGRWNLSFVASKHVSR